MTKNRQWQIFWWQNDAWPLSACPGFGNKRNKWVWYWKKLLSKTMTNGRVSSVHHTQYYKLARKYRFLYFNWSISRRHGMTFERCPTAIGTYNAWPFRGQGSHSQSRGPRSRTHVLHTLGTGKQTNENNFCTSGFWNQCHVPIIMKYWEHFP